MADRVEEWALDLTVGVNVSGLLRDAAAHAQFGLAGDYIATMTAAVRGLLSAGARVLFVPHVHDPDGVGESDVAAIARVRERLTPAERDRAMVLPPHLDAAEIKWVVARLDWFVGSRMHATIAALSTCTPAAAYAYSDKTLGVFETCGAGSQVVDARRSHGVEAVEAILASFHDRQSIRAQLTARVPTTVEQSRDQLSSMLESVMQWRDGATRVGSIA